MGVPLLDADFNPRPERGDGVTNCWPQEGPKSAAAVALRANGPVDVFRGQMFRFLATTAIGVFWLIRLSAALQKTDLPALVIVTVATEETDGLKRLRDSAQHYGHRLLVFGMGEKWNGGDMQSTGGGQKVRILREGLSATFGERDDVLLMFVDAYDVIIAADPQTIVQRFVWEYEKFRIVFGAEPFCWPDPQLANSYPVVTFGERYLNSGLFMGYAPALIRLLEHGKDVGDGDDDQRFYTQLYLDAELRQSHRIGLDSLSRIFQNLNGMYGHVELETDADGGVSVSFPKAESYFQVYNKLYNTHPAIIHGNGPSKIQLNAFGNYIVEKYNMKTGCADCSKLNTFPTKPPNVAMAVFIPRPIPYVEEFFESIAALDYPRSHIDLFLYNNQLYNGKLVSAFVDRYGPEFKTIKLINLDSEIDERRSREESIKWAVEADADFYFAWDADVHFTNSQTLKTLIRRSVTHDINFLTPMVLQPGKLFSNFWGAVSNNGFYERSDDYIEIAEGTRRGLWNVPYAGSAYLIRKGRYEQMGNGFAYNPKNDPDMSFAAFCRFHNYFMFVDNLDDYGILLATELFNQLTDQTIHKELYDYPNNKVLWESRYVHPKYRSALSPNTKIEEVCPDVYDFPLVSERFSAEMIEVMENFGQWSTGKNEDERLVGGYENVPTRDIHMKQVGLHNQFLSFLDDYVAPIQEKIFYGYYARPVKSDMMFVVRYKPEEQPSLRPHLDASTYSIDVALNRRGVDYEGGGVRYIRYNCTVPADQIGYAMIFPGRLTHLHEGLPTTEGTRYILVSFINP